MMFVTAIPLIGLIMVFVWAFSGDNESRKNYYRAILMWVLVITLVTVGLIMAGGTLGNWPAIHKHLQQWMHKG